MLAGTGFVQSASPKRYCRQCSGRFLATGFSVSLT
jgi:hypothetical protein